MAYGEEKTFALLKQEPQTQNAWAWILATKQISELL